MNYTRVYHPFGPLPEPREMVEKTLEDKQGVWALQEIGEEHPTPMNFSWSIQDHGPMSVGVFWDNSYELIQVWRGKPKFKELSLFQKIKYVYYQKMSKNWGDNPEYTIIEWCRRRGLRIHTVLLKKENEIYCVTSIHSPMLARAPESVSGMINRIFLNISQQRYNMFKKLYPECQHIVLGDFNLMKHKSFATYVPSKRELNPEYEKLLTTEGVDKYLPKVVQLNLMDCPHDIEFTCTNAYGFHDVLDYTLCDKKDVELDEGPIGWIMPNNINPSDHTWLSMDMTKPGRSLTIVVPPDSPSLGVITTS